MPTEAKTRVPALALDREFQELKADFFARLEELGTRANFVLGRAVEEFEATFAAYLGMPDAAGVNSGTDALILALRALDIGPGDQVVTTPFTFVSTATAIRWVGAAPVFADIDRETFCLDPAQVAKVVRRETKVLIPVHLFGHAADMDALAKVAGRAAIVEDCAQALGAQWKGKPVGTFGTLGAFSFYPTKILGAYGDAGAVVARDRALVARIRELRNHGRGEDGAVHALGLNSRMDAMQAVLLDLKLDRLARDIERRLARAERYLKLFSEARLAEITLPRARPGTQHVYHQFVIRAKRRDALLKHLTASGIEARIYYERPVHLEPSFSHLGLRQGSLPVAEEAARSVLALPLFPQMTEEEQDYVVRSVAEFYRG